MGKLANTPRGHHDAKAPNATQQVREVNKMAPPTSVYKQVFPVVSLLTIGASNTHRERERR